MRLPCTTAESHLVEKLRIECLACGSRRSAVGDERHLDAGECPKCGYVGWARVSDLNEVARKLLRERPVERRRLRIV